jgi:protein O-mannosyl-transferase
MRDRPATSVLSAAGLRAALGAAVIAVAVCAVYSGSLVGGFIMDDGELVTDNIVVKSPSGLHQAWCSLEAIDYWPATNTMFWIEWRLWGASASGYHVTNVILHIAESLLIWVILRRLSIPGAFLAGMIFAIHPVNVESVAWISQGKNVMCMLFLLLAALWYLEALRAHGGTVPIFAGTAAKQWSAKKGLSLLDRSHPSSLISHPSSFIPRPSSFYFLSLGAFALSMLSKGSAVVLPVLMLGMVWWLRPLKLRDIVRLVPFLALAAVLAVVNMWFQTHGSHDAIRSAGFTERLLGAGGVIWFYLYKAILPLDLAFIYPQWHIETGKLLWWLPLLAALLVTAILWLYSHRCERARLGGLSPFAPRKPRSVRATFAERKATEEALQQKPHRSGWARALLFAWGFFCVALAPVLGFADVGFMKYSLVSDHYQHIAIIGVIALASAGWAVWHRSVRGTGFWPPAAAFAALGILALLGWRQSEIYGDTIALYRDALEKNPKAWFVKNNLGLALAGKGRTDEAIDMYEQSLELNPDYVEAHSNLGLALDSLGRFDEAIEHCRRAISLRPDCAVAWNNLGLSLVKTGRLPEAIADYEEALRLQPEYAHAHNNLAAALVKAGRFEEGIEHNRRALAIEPDKPEYHFNLANALTRAGARKDGIEEYKQALRLNPDYFFAHNNLGTALMRAGNVQEGIVHLEKASQLKPDDVNFLGNLGRAYAEAHQAAEAIATMEKAVALAKSQGKTAQAQDMANWLNSYRGNTSASPAQGP